MLGDVLPQFQRISQELNSYPFTIRSLEIGCSSDGKGDGSNGSPKPAPLFGVHVSYKLLIA